MSPFDTAVVWLLVGIAVGVAVTAGRRWLEMPSGRKKRSKKSEDARDLAMCVVLSLDDLVGACYMAAHDIPEIDADEPTQFFFHSDDPLLHLPKDVDWSLLGRELSDEVRWLPNRLRNQSDALESIEIDPPDYKDLFERRQDGYAKLGINALDLIDRICAQYDIPLPERPDYFSPRDDLAAKVCEMEEFWKRRAETARHLPGGKSNVTPLFGRDSPENQII